TRCWADISADKRAHHNALERKRRDHIKDSFHSLRDSVPSLQGEKASRAQILDKATEYIQYMRRKNHTHQQDIDDLKRQNALLEQQGELSEPEEPQSRKKLRMEAS
uniref:Protein max n=1 Tax=Pelusios castaneus TaxID=367368 RepID=A0A8C8RG97_9SAUR